MQHCSLCASSSKLLALAVLSCLLLGSAAVPFASSSTPPGDEQSPPEFTLLKPRAPLPIPTPEQLRYQGSMNALVHFGMATFFHDGDPGCDRENWNGCDPSGGCNSSDARSFNPSNLNVSNWIQSFIELGVSTAVLTAKHGCGFLAWRTNTTLPDGRLYPYHVSDDQAVAKKFVAATSAAGIGHGFYYSLTNNFFLNARSHVVQPPSTLLPGQANVTQAQFEDLALAQITELWTEFGGLAEIWLDGGCGAMCDRVGALVRQLQPTAVVFNGQGVSDSPVRWCGTESGDPVPVGGAVWSTSACEDVSCLGTGSPPNTSGATWQPSGVDVTLQQDDRWFYTPGQKIHPLVDLVSFYHRSVGMNGHLEIDFAISRTGEVDPVHALAYKSFGDWIRSCYGAPVAVGGLLYGETSLTISLPPGGSLIDRVMLQEDQTRGQFIVSYVVQVHAGGSWQPFSSGVSVGQKRIDIGTPVLAAAVRVSVTEAWATPTGLVAAAFSPQACNLAPFEYATQ
jgi:alpha-L-fucosidase